MQERVEVDPVEAEWRAVLAAVPADVRASVRDLVRAVRVDHARRFYELLLEDPAAATYLDHEVVRSRLQPGLEGWLLELFTLEDAVDLAAVIARQRQIAEVHARAHIPLELVARGARALERWLFDDVVDWFADRDRALVAVRHVRDQIDLALQVMSTTHVRRSERGARADEAYRLYSVTQNIATERERQRAALLDWTQRALFAFQSSRLRGMLPELGRSEFGLWFGHRAAMVFEGAPELAPIAEAVERVDGDLMPQLAASHAGEERAGALIDQLQRETEAIQFHLATLFERYVQVDSGRDVLTRLLSRRFLGSILSHEIAVHRRSARELAVLVVDIDGFKALNDLHGHAGGDLVLQQVALLIGDGVRAGDYVIRYGGDEFVVVLVEAPLEAAVQVAEGIRARIAATAVSVGSGVQAYVTVSIGVAAFDGHPDYQHLFNRADRAMAAAKGEGRDRVATDATGAPGAAAL